MIIHVDSFDEMTDSTVFYKYNNKFYTLCDKCKSPAIVPYPEEQDMESPKTGFWGIYCKEHENIETAERFKEIHGVDYRDCNKVLSAAKELGDAYAKKLYSCDTEYSPYDLGTILIKFPIYIDHFGEFGTYVYWVSFTKDEEYVDILYNTNSGEMFFGDEANAIYEQEQDAYDFCKYTFIEPCELDIT